MSTRLPLLQPNLSPFCLTSFTLHACSQHIQQARPIHCPPHTLQTGSPHMLLTDSPHTLLTGLSHMLLIGVPTMSLRVRDQARRFITLIDELYNARVRLICSADSPPDLLFAGDIHEEPLIDLEQLQFEAAVEGVFTCCIMCTVCIRQHAPLTCRSHAASLPCNCWFHAAWISMVAVPYVRSCCSLCQVLLSPMPGTAATGLDLLSADPFSGWAALQACMPCRRLVRQSSKYRAAGSRLRRNLMAEGGVAPVAATPLAAQAATQNLGGVEEKFAFARAVSRLYEMQSEVYLRSRDRV